MRTAELSDNPILTIILYFVTRKFYTLSKMVRMGSNSSMFIIWNIWDLANTFSLKTKKLLMPTTLRQYTILDTRNGTQKEFFIQIMWW